MAEPLTDARVSLWTAINAWPTTASAFKRKFDFSGESAGVYEIAPAPSDFPCIAIFPANVDPVWWTHRDQQWTYALQVEIWVRDWVLAPAEKLIRYVIQAIFQAAPDGSTCTYVERGAGQLPTFGSASVERVRVGENESIRAIKATVVILLKPKFDPLDSGASVIA